MSLRSENCTGVAHCVNATFDGDQLQVKLLVDNKEKAQFARLKSHLNLMDTSHPNRIGKHITYHPEVTTMTNNYLSMYRESSKGV